MSYSGGTMRIGGDEGGLEQLEVRDVRDPREDRAAAEAPQLREVSGPLGDRQPTRQPRPRLRPVPVEAESPPPAGPAPRRSGDRRDGRPADLVRLLSVE